MKSWLKLALGLSGLLVLVNCADGKSYPAPYGSTLELSVDSISIGSYGGVVLIEARAIDPNQGEDGMMLNNTQVTVQGNSDYVLIPESAISVKSSSADTDWQCHADEQPNVDQCVATQCAGLSGDDYSNCETTCRTNYCAEQYYQWSVSNPEILPNYLETATDDHGIASVYVYFRCLPTSCGTNYGEATGCALGGSDLFPNDEESCTVSSTDLLFSIGVDADTIAVTSDLTIKNPDASTTAKPVSAKP